MNEQISCPCIWKNILSVSLFISVLLFSQPSWALMNGFVKEPDKNPSSRSHCILSKEKEQIKVKRDGSYVDRDEVFIKIVDEKGKRRQQVQHFYLNKNYSHLEIKKMAVIKPDGRSIEVDLKNNSTLTDPSSVSRMNIYDPNLKVLNVFIPNLNPGDTIHYIVEVDNFKPMIQGHFFGRSLLQQTFPVKNISLEIELPEDMPFHYLIKGGSKGVDIQFGKSFAHGMARYRWHFKDIPELVPEPYMPEISRVAMRLLFSTLSSWKDVSKWYYDLVAPKLKVNDAIKKEVERLVRGKNSERQRLDALFFFVARRIRYLGIIEEANRPGFEPHDVSLTFERRYGVCRDKAALLVAMLRVAGFPAAPVLVSAGSKLDPEMAIPNFNHAIAAVLDNSGQPKIYMDPTSETSRQFLPDYEQDSSCLPALPQGSDLLVTPIKAPDSNLFTMEIADVLHENGTLTGRLEAMAHGFADTAFRSVLMRKSKDEQERFLKIFLLKRQPRLLIQEISWLDPGDDSKNFFFECKFELPGALKKSGDLFPFSACGALGLMDSWLLKRASMVTRTYPLRIGYTFETIIKESMNFDLPYCKVRLPETKGLENGFFKYKTSYSLQKDGMSIVRVLSIKKLEIPPAYYNGLLKVQALMEASGLQSMSLEACSQE